MVIHAPRLSVIEHRPLACPKYQIMVMAANPPPMHLWMYASTKEFLGIGMIAIDTHHSSTYSKQKDKVRPIKQ
jgi:hypothetical protein